jgi:peptidoglycan-associated lipoprotein
MFLVLAVSLFQLGCERRDRSDTPPTVEKVVENTADYMNRQVTVTGEVDEVFSDRAFQLEAPGFFEGEDIVVLTRKPVRTGIGTDIKDVDAVRVTGTVRRFNVTEMERDIGWDIEPNFENDWSDDAVIVAESVQLMRGTSDWTEQRGWQTRTNVPSHTNGAAGTGTAGRNDATGNNPGVATMTAATFFFAKDSTELSAADRAIVSETAQWMKANPNRYAIVHGYASDPGTVPHNLALGVRRANAVRNALTKEGVDKSRVVVVSHGEKGPDLAASVERRAVFVSDAPH